MNRLIRRIVTFSIAIVLVLWGCMPMQGMAQSNNENWMSDIDDEMYLSQITIPGTHDSGTKHIPLGYFMKCQNSSITKQLEMGYRYLDIRLGLFQKEGEPDRLRVIHGFANCHVGSSPFSEYLYLEDVLKDVYEFLDNHPTETVIVNMKVEAEDDPIETVAALMYDSIQQNSEYWYTRDTIPTLGEVRGKAVLGVRFEDVLELGEDKTGIQLLWEDQGSETVVDIPYVLTMNDDIRLWVQDRYNYDVKYKIDAVVDGLENCEADEHTIFLNFVSTSGKSPVGHPKGYAKELNKLLLDYNLESQTSYGIIIVDFGTKELATHIYNSNF